MEDIIKEYLGDNLCDQLPKSFHDFYGRLCYEVIRFLTESEEQVLFFNMPVEELSNEISKQDKYWKEICEVTALALRLSLKREQLIPGELSYPGNWYHENDKFLLIPSEKDKEEFYYIICEGDGKILRFIWKNKVGRGVCGYPKSLKDETIRAAKAIYRLNEIPAQYNNGYQTCCKEIQYLETLTSSWKYSSGMLICAPCPQEVSFAGKYVSPVVEILNNNSRIPQKDVAVIVGDKAFGRIQQLLNSLAPYGTTKKIIVFGSQPPSILMQRNPKIVNLTFKDINRYCAPKNVEYFNPEFIGIDFPWLEDVLSGLKAILDRFCDEMGIENARHIYNFSRKVLSDIDFSSKKLNAFKTFFIDFIDKVLENIYSDEIYNDLEKWVYGLSYVSDSNPKRDYAKGKKAAKTITLNRSIRNQLKDLQGNGNLIVIDAPLHKNDITYSNPITTVMRFHNFAKIQCVYYNGIETNLMKFSLSNLERDCSYQDNCNGVVTGDVIEREEFRLEDYLDYDDGQNNFIYRVYDTDKITFTDGTKEYVTGDVLVYESDETLTRMSIKDIEILSGLTIMYYSQNNNNSDVFDELVQAQFKLPQGRDIKYYSTLWQEALKSLVKGWDKDKRTEFCKEIGISLAVLSNHIKGESKFMKKNSMNKILKKLICNKLITEDDAKYVKAARTFMNGKNISFGSKLKDALFEYKLSRSEEPPASLKTILEETGLTVGRIADEFLYTKTIK